MARKKAYHDALNNIISFNKSRIKNASRSLDSNTSKRTNNAITFDALRKRNASKSLDSNTSQRTNNAVTFDALRKENASRSLDSNTPEETNNAINYNALRKENTSRSLDSNTPEETNNAINYNALRNRRVNNSSKKQSNLLSEKELLHDKYYDKDGNLNTTMRDIYGTDATVKCIFDLNPTFTGMASTTPKISADELIGTNVFNVYQAIGTGISYSNSPRLEGSIEFETIPCVQELQIRVIGRADTYGAGFDTLSIKVDNVQKAFFDSIDRDPFSYSIPLSNTFNYDTIVTLPFNDDGIHTVNISGRSGSVANNNIGYDIKITHTK